MFNYTFVITVATRPAMRPVQSKNMWKLKEGGFEIKHPLISTGSPVWNKTQGVGPDPIEELDEGEGEIEKQKAEKIPRVGISKDEANPVTLQ